MATPPILTPEQRTAALKKAAEARTARAELKEKLKMGSVTLKEALTRADGDPVIGKLMGHSNSQTTERYAHLLDGPLRAATDSFAEALKDATTAS